MPAPALLAWLAAASLAGFAAMAADKRRARRGRRRVPEAAFHALAMLGGWPGVLAGVAAWRHKNRKPRFLALLALAAAVDLAALGWWLARG